MMETSKGDIFLACLDQMLAGEKDVGPVEDDEIAEMLQLVQTMIAAGNNVNLKTREALKLQIMEQLKLNSKVVVLPSNDEELDDEALSYVAAGFSPQDEELNSILKNIQLPGNPKNKG